MAKHSKGHEQGCEHCADSFFVNPLAVLIIYKYFSKNKQINDNHTLPDSRRSE